MRLSLLEKAFSAGTARNIGINKGNTKTMTYSGNDEFFMNMSFTDETDDTPKGHFMLYVTKNSKPKFTNLNSKYIYVTVSNFK